MVLRYWIKVGTLVKKGGTWVMKGVGLLINSGTLVVKGVTLAMKGDTLLVKGGTLVKKQCYWDKERWYLS